VAPADGHGAPPAFDKALDLPPGASPSERVNLLLARAGAQVKEGNPLAAMRTSARARAISVADFAQVRGPDLVRDTILPRVASDMLPAPSGISASGSPTFLPEDLARYDALVALLRECQALFPAEAEDALRPTARAADLAAAVVDGYLERGDPAGAHDWLLRKAVRSATLAARVAEAERAKAAALAPNQPAETQGRASAALASIATATSRAVRKATQRPRAAYDQLSSVDDLLLALPPAPTSVPEMPPLRGEAGSVHRRWTTITPVTPSEHLPPIPLEVHDRGSQSSSVFQRRERVDQAAQPLLAS